MSISISSIFYAYLTFHAFALCFLAWKHIIKPELRYRRWL